MAECVKVWLSVLKVFFPLPKFQNCHFVLLSREELKILKRPTSQLFGVSLCYCLASFMQWGKCNLCRVCPWTLRQGKLGEERRVTYMACFRGCSEDRYKHASTHTYTPDNRRILYCTYLKTVCFCAICSVQLITFLLGMMLPWFTI